MNRFAQRGVAAALLIIVILFVAIAGAVALVSMRPPPEKKELANLDLLVETWPLVETSERFLVASQGSVRPRTQTILSAELSGTIVSVSPRFVAGGVFAKGEELMRIDPSNYSVAVEQASALLKQRQIEYDGALSLKEKGYRADADLASASAALASANAGLDRARRDMERTHIRLPYAGMVRSKDVDIGQFVNPGTRLGVAFATDYAEVRLPLTDQDLAFLDLPRAGVQVDDGLAVQLLAQSRGRQSEWRARVTRTEGVVDETTRVTYAIARIDDPYKLTDPDAVPLPIGTFVRALIAGETRDNIIKVPSSALRGADQLLFVDDDNRLQIRRVEVLRADQDFAYLAGGAESGERITVTVIESPLNGMKVRVDAGDDEDRRAQSSPDAATE